MNQYISSKKDGLPEKDDFKFVGSLLSSFMNPQTALFQRWCEVKLPKTKDLKRRLIILTPLRFIIIRKRTFGRSVQKKIPLINISEFKVKKLKVK